MRLKVKLQQVLVALNCWRTNAIPKLPQREIRDLKHRQRNARRRPSQPKEDWVEGFVLVVLRRRRVLVLRLVALAMAFKHVRNLLLINHNDGLIDDHKFVVLYDLSASKNLDFPYDSYTQFDLEELDESESFAAFRFGKRDIRILKEVLQIPDMITCSECSVCDGLESLYAVEAAFIPMQIWRHDP